MNPSLTTELSKTDTEIREAFPKLKTARDVAALLEVPYSLLAYVLYRAPTHTRYKSFLIKKRRGGVRAITAPLGSQKILQTKLNRVLSALYEPRIGVHGYVRDRSIRTNARVHTGKRHILNVDLEDFFPTINFGRVRGVFMAKPFELPDAAATVLAQICCHDGSLPQGAPTSPIISNMVCVRLDNALRLAAKKHRCDFTRYADDITFSTTRPQFPVGLASSETSVTGEQVNLGQDLLKRNPGQWIRLKPEKNTAAVAGFASTSYWSYGQSLSQPSSPVHPSDQVNAACLAKARFGGRRARAQCTLRPLGERAVGRRSAAFP